MSSNVQIINTESGEQLAVLPLKDYNSLVDRLEELRDIEDADATRRRIDRGEEELIPAEVVNRLVDGENPIRVYREYRGMTIRDLAGEVGISAPYLSEIETGKKEGAASTLKAIAQALKVDLDELV